MQRHMLVIGGSWDGQRVAWDDREPIMRVDTKGPRKLLPGVQDILEGLVPVPEIPEERYSVERLWVNEPVWFLVHIAIKESGSYEAARDILCALIHGYRKPYACPECHQVPNACAYCGYGEAAQKTR